MEWGAIWSTHRAASRYEFTQSWCIGRRRSGARFTIEAGSAPNQTLDGLEASPHPLRLDVPTPHRPSIRLSNWLHLKASEELSVRSWSTALRKPLAIPTQSESEKTAHLTPDWLRGYVSMLRRASDMTELKTQYHTRNRYAKRFVGILNGSPSSVNKQRVYVQLNLSH